MRDSLSQDNLQLEIKSHLASLSKSILNFVTKDNPGREVYHNTQIPLKTVEEASKLISRVTATPAAIATFSELVREAGAGARDVAEGCSGFKTRLSQSGGAEAATARGKKQRTTSDRDRKRGGPGMQERDEARDEASGMGWAGQGEARCLRLPLRDTSRSRPVPPQPPLHPLSFPQEIAAALSPEREYAGTASHRLQPH